MRVAGFDDICHGKRAFNCECCFQRFRQFASKKLFGQVMRNLVALCPQLVAMIIDDVFGREDFVCFGEPGNTVKTVRVNCVEKHDAPPFAMALVTESGGVAFRVLLLLLFIVIPMAHESDSLQDMVIFKSRMSIIQIL